MKKHLTLIFIFFLLSLAFINIPFVKCASSITYNIGTNTITVIGNYTNLHWELWNASFVNGWNVVHKLGEANYLINNTVIQIGDDLTTTICSDLSVNVLFETNQRWGYYVRDNAILTFGQQDSGYATSMGVNINWNSSYGSTNTGVIRGSVITGNSKLNLYSCSIKSTYTNHPETYVSQLPYFSSSVPNVVIYNCFFDKVRVENYVNIYNLVIFRGMYGLSSIDGTLEQIFLYDIRYAIIVSGASKTIKDVNIIAVDSITGIRWTGSNYNHSLVNVAWSGASDWLFYWHYAPYNFVFRQYEFDLTVTYSNGTAINGTETGARVVIQHFGNNSGVDYNATLNADGTINTTVLSMGFYNQTYGNVLQDYNPFNLRVYNITGYVEYNGNFTLNKKEHFCTAICLDTDIDSFQAIGLIIMVSCLGIGLIVIVIKGEKKK